jgi:hypothetical protein
MLSNYDTWAGTRMINYDILAATRPNDSRFQSDQDPRPNKGPHVPSMFMCPSTGLVLEYSCEIIQ